MGEEKQEETKDPGQPEEKKLEEKKEEKPEEKKEEKAEAKKEKPKLPVPVTLGVDMHCVGCARKVEQIIMKFRGVEAVEIDMVQNKVKIKGIVDPEALCLRIQKKTKRKTTLLSPLPTEKGDNNKLEIVTSQASEMAIVELHVNMHCEACAQQLKKKILNMRGVQTAETELSTGKVTVTGTMDANRLVEYVYRRTRKLARIVPQPPTEKEEEKQKEEAKPEGKVPEEAKPEEKKEEEKPSVPEKGDNNKDNSNNSEEKGEAAGDKKEEENNEENAKKMMYLAITLVRNRASATPPDF